MLFFVKYRGQAPSETREVIADAPDVDAAEGAVQSFLDEHLPGYLVIGSGSVFPFFITESPDGLPYQTAPTADGGKLMSLVAKRHAKKADDGTR